MESLEQIAAKYPNDAVTLANVTGERREKFEAWMTELEAYHQKVGQPYGAKPIAEITGPVCWLSWFDDGYTPDEALDEDMTNG